MRRFLCIFLILLIFPTIIIPSKNTVAQEVGQYHELMRLGRGNIWTSAWNPDGTMIAISGSQGVWLYDENFELINHIYTTSTRDIAWHPDGTIIAVEDSQSVVVLDSATGEIMSRLPDGTRLSAWRPDGVLLAVSLPNHEVGIWDFASQNFLRTYNGLADEDSTSSSERIRLIRWNPSGQYIASIHGEKLFIWNALTAETETEFEDDVYYGAWHPNNDTIAINTLNIGKASTIKIWDTHTKTFTMTISEGYDPMELAWSPNGESLATIRTNQRVIVYDANTLERLTTFHPNLEGYFASDTEWNTRISWHPDGTRILTSTIGSAKVWDSETGTVISALQGHMAWVRSLVWNSDGTQIATGHGSGYGQEGDTRLRIWDVRTGQILNTCEGHDGQIGGVAWSSDDSRIAASSGDISSDGLIIVWDPLTCQGVSLGNFYTIFVSVLSWTPDDNIVVHDGSLMIFDPTIEFIDTPYYAAIQTFDNGDNAAITWLDNNLRFALAASDSVVAQDFVEEETSVLAIATDFIPPDSEEKISTLAWKPDGSLLAIGTEGDFEAESDHINSVYLWELDTNTVSELSEVPFDVSVLAWSPDGSLLAIGDTSGNIALWDIEHAEMTQTLTAHTRQITAIEWSPNGELIATGSLDSTVHIWEKN